MSAPLLLFVLLALSAVAFEIGRRRALSVSGGITSNLHSRPRYYGSFTALWCLLPALIVAGLWLFLQENLITWILTEELPGKFRQMTPEQLNLVINDIRNQAGTGITTQDPDLRAAIERYLNLRSTARDAMWVAVLSLAIIGVAFAWSRISPQFRALTTWRPFSRSS